MRFVFDNFERNKMNRSGKNKENQSKGESKKINSFFKVSKRLFESAKLENTPPECDLLQLSSPVQVQDDSPYLYELHKKKVVPSKLVQKFAKCSAMSETPLKRSDVPLKRSDVSIKQRIPFNCNIIEGSDDEAARTWKVTEGSDDEAARTWKVSDDSDDEATRTWKVSDDSDGEAAMTWNATEDSDDEAAAQFIMEDGDDEAMPCSPPYATIEFMEEVMRRQEEGTLTGDFSKECLLPVIKGKHPELSTINSQTLANLLLKEHTFDVTLIDCRYPYEFRAGHIKSALNMFYKENVEVTFFHPDVTASLPSEKILIFYCEFSSERAPSMMRYIRNRDRKLNVGKYPRVHYPEMYLLEGGYKSFFADFKELCDPENYKPMLAKENTTEFTFFRNLCKTFDQKLQKDSEFR